MSEGDPKPEPKPEPKPPEGDPKPPEVDVEAITEAAMTAATASLRAEIDELKACSKGISEDDVEKLVNARHKEMIGKMLGEEKSEPEAHVLHKFFASDPEGFVTKLMEKVVEYQDGRADSAQEENQKLMQAWASVFTDRADITESTEAKEVVLSYYASQDDSISSEERFKTALNKYDKLMEKSGAGTAEQRVAALQSLGGSGAASSGGEATPTPVDRIEAARAEQKEKVKAHKARLNGVNFQGAVPIAD